MYKNVIDPGKSVYFVMKDIDIGGQNQHAMCTGPLAHSVSHSTAGDQCYSPRLVKYQWRT